MSDGTAAGGDSRRQERGAEEGLPLLWSPVSLLTLTVSRRTNSSLGARGCVLRIHSEGSRCQAKVLGAEIPPGASSASQSPVPSEITLNSGGAKKGGSQKAHSPEDAEWNAPHHTHLHPHFMQSASRGQELHLTQLLFQCSPVQASL